MRLTATWAEYCSPRIEADADWTAEIMIRFVHTADWQLGMAPKFLNDEARARFAAARIDIIGTIGALARKTGCDFVVVAGDVFESNQVDRATVRRALDTMAEAGLPFFLLPGNHDPLEPGSVFRTDPFLSHQPANVRVLEGGGPVVPMAGVEIVGAPWLSKRPVRDLVGEACRDLAPVEAGVRIVVGHGAVDMLSPDSRSPQMIRVERLEDVLSRHCVHYVALGDRHSTTKIGQSDAIWYSGAPEPTDFTEIDAGNVLVVELDRGSVGVAPHRVGTWHFVDKVVDVNGSEDIAQVANWLSDQSSKSTTLIRLAPVGTVGLQRKAMLDVLIEEEGHRFAAILLRASRSDLVVMPQDSDFSDLGLSGFAASTVARLREQASGHDGEAAQNALSLLYRLAGGDPG
jgi:DNA repair exonuclease SbcCD nuclease subunit